MPGPVNPQPQNQGCNCGCPSGTNIGSCNSQNQCPGQSQCQAAVAQPPANNNCQQACGSQVSVCCYNGSGKK